MRRRDALAYRFPCCELIRLARLNEQGARHLWALSPCVAWYQHRPWPEVLDARGAVLLRERCIERDLLRLGWPKDSWLICCVICASWLTMRSISWRSEGSLASGGQTLETLLVLGCWSYSRSAASARSLSEALAKTAKILCQAAGNRFMKSSWMKASSVVKPEATRCSSLRS